MANAANGYFAISKETTPYTAITVPTKYYPLEEVNIEWENEFIDWQENRGSRQATQSEDGPVRPTARISGAVYPGGAMGSFLKGLFGSHTSALEALSTVAYRHKFEDAPVLPTYTLERATGRGGSALLCQRVAGAKVESVSITAAFGEKIQMEVSFQATKLPVTATAVNSGSVIYPTMKPLMFTHAVVEIDDVAVATFKDIKMEFTNTLERDEVLNGSTLSEGIDEATMEMTLSATTSFRNLDLYNKMTNTTPMKIEVAFTSTEIADAVTTPDILYALKFTYENVRLASFDTPFTAGEVVTGDAMFKVRYDSINSRMALAELINLDTATAYNS